MFLQIVCVCYCSPDDTDTRGSRCAHEQDQSFGMKFCVAICGRKRPKFGPPTKNFGSPKNFGPAAWTRTKVSRTKVFAVRSGLNATRVQHHALIRKAHARAAGAEQRHTLRIVDFLVH